MSVVLPGCRAGLFRGTRPFCAAFTERKQSFAVEKCEFSKSQSRSCGGCLKHRVLPVSAQLRPLSSRRRTEAPREIRGCMAERRFARSVRSPSASVCSAGPACHFAERNSTSARPPARTERVRERSANSDHAGHDADRLGGDGKSGSCLNGLWCATAAWRRSCNASCPYEVINEVDEFRSLGSRCCAVGLRSQCL